MWGTVRPADHCANRPTGKNAGAGVDRREVSTTITSLRRLLTGCKVRRCLFAEQTLVRRTACFFDALVVYTAGSFTEDLQDGQR